MTSKLADLSLAPYLEALTRIVFQTGFNPVVVAAKWPAIRTAFADFDPERVAGFDDDAVRALLANAAIVRNERKIRATIENARMLMTFAREHGGIAAYIATFDSADAAAAALAGRFVYLGKAGALAFLTTLGIADGKRAEAS